MTTSRHVADARSAGGPWTAWVRPPAVAAAIGVAVAAVVALLRTAQLPAGMGALDMTMSGAGVGVWVALSVVPAVVIGLLGRASPATAVARGLVIGLLWWVSWNLTLLPLLLGVRPGWSSASVTVGFADLVATLLHGAVTGLGWSAVAARVVGVARGPDEDRADLPRVVVLGGGFAGVAVARRLERLARRRSRWDVTLVSDRNFLLFTPMLPEVAGGRCRRSTSARHCERPVPARASFSVASTKSTSANGCCGWALTRFRTTTSCSSWARSRRSTDYPASPSTA